MKACKATGQRITGKDYFVVRKCSEFLPRAEYIVQFYNPLDKAVDLMEKGKRIKDIVDPL